MPFEAVSDKPIANECRPTMNAVSQWQPALGRSTVRRLGGCGTLASRNLEKRFRLDLAGLLNRLYRHELDDLAHSIGVAEDGSIGGLRARLWLRGAALEAGSLEHVGSAVQPAPIVLGERLVFQGPVRGKFASPTGWPRPVPESRKLRIHSTEPSTAEELLGRVDALVGVRLGKRGQNKGQYGSSVAEWLGVVEHGRSEPDWRGQIELKTVPVLRDRSGLWRVKEDPAVSMEHAEPHLKLARVIWIARVADDPGSPILSWYYQERDDEVGALMAKFLHTRPKGPAGARTRGWYLHKRFFLESGFLASLNG